MEKEKLINTNEELWFRGFCTEDEIKKILFPKSPEDFLISKRANIIADNARYTRVFLHNSRMENTMSLSASFREEHYERYLLSLSKIDKEQCKGICYGDMFTDVVNGFAESHEKWGRLIYLNESLSFFMKFCNLALFDFGNQVPIHVKQNSMRVAARIILKTESMDFVMDPRGKIPAHIMNSITNQSKYELQFITGHEFGHHLCGHLNDDKLVKKNFLTTENHVYSANIYSISQQEEFQADIDSLNRPKYNSKTYEKLYESSLIWFLSLDIAESIQDIINPIPQYKKSLQSHPSSTDRIANIIENTKKPSSLNEKKLISIQENAKRMKFFLEEDISLNVDDYEMYGSVYLDKPDSNWRGRQLIDRVDY